MELLSVRALHGPNVWARMPMMVAEFLGEPPSDFGWYLEQITGRPHQVVTGPNTLAFEFEDEELGRRCLNASESDLAELREFAEDVLMGPNTRALYEAARRRNIPVRRLDRGSLLQLGHGVKQRRLRGAFTDRTSSIGEHIGWEKPIAKELLRAVGVPVPEGRVVADADEAWRVACELGGPVVVKPESANHGRGVFIGLTTRDEVMAAFAAASEAGSVSTVLVERMIKGAEHRVLVIHGEAVAATRGDALIVTGDGRRSIAQLVDEVNRDPRRGESINHPLDPVTFDETTLAVLAHQSYTAESVPGEGIAVLIQRNGNLATDVSENIHPDNRAICRLAAATVGLDVAGIDVVVEDLGRPLREQGGAILEVNAMPGLVMHLYPGSGTPRRVDDLIVGTLYAPGEDGRIPIVALCQGSAQPLVEKLRAAGMMAMAAGPDSREVRDLLLHPFLEAAVVEISDQAVREQGLGFDMCQVLVNVEALSPEIQRVLRGSLAPGGVETGSIDEAVLRARR